MNNGILHWNRRVVVKSEKANGVEKIYYRIPYQLLKPGTAVWFKTRISSALATYFQSRPGIGFSEFAVAVDDLCFDVVSHDFYATVVLYQYE